MNSLKSLVVVFGLSLCSVSALAAETVNLACTYESDLDASSDPRGSTFSVIVGDESKFVTLRTSSASSATIQAKKYAVVMRNFPLDGSQPDWYVLQAGQFSLTADSSGENFHFVNRKTGKPLTCGIDHEVFINPAVSRSN